MDWSQVLERWSTILALPVAVFGVLVAWRALKPAKESDVPHFIYSVMNSKCLDVPWEAEIDVVHMWEFHGNVNQRWCIVKVSGNLFKIFSQYTGKCLEIEEQLPSNGARAKQGNFKGKPHQLWRISRLSPGVYSILNQHSGKALDLLGWADEDGALIGQWSWDGESKQRWRIEPPID
jgi:hypothetical protein